MRSRLTPRLFGLLAVTPLLFAPKMLWSVPLAVGDNVISGTTSAARPELAGVVVEDVLTPYKFERSGKILKGEIQNRVVRSDVDGSLDFYWRIRPDPSSTGEITAFRVGGFGSFSLDGDWRIDGLGSVAPEIARNFGTGSVNFLFPDSGVGPAEDDSSRFFFLDTKATHYTQSGQYDLLCANNGCISPLFPTFAPAVLTLQPGDADQDLDYDQFDIVRVQRAGKYRTGRRATWGEGDWNGAPGGEPGNPPRGDGVFDQFDIIAAQRAGLYLTGPYAALQPDGQHGDGQTSVGYDAGTGEVWVDVPDGVELTSLNVESAHGIFGGTPAQSLGGSFDADTDDTIFKATFGAGFGSMTFGQVAQAGLSQEFVRNDLAVVGTLAGGQDVGNVDLIYVPVPEPSTILLLALGLTISFVCCQRGK